MHAIFLGYLRGRLRFLNQACPHNARAINEIKNEYYRTLFKNNEALAQNASYPLLAFIQQQLTAKTKLAYLVGHDSNIVALLAALGVEPYELDDSLENIPIGGKLLFECGNTNQVVSSNLNWIMFIKPLNN